ncbi:phosphotransferase [Brevibacillus sp. 179-C9.3 HS]|uniref:phosphotransferase n=1 Tax=unclassified Brevibacillus TaxID=2684853 RepID=UPI0039A3B023
MDKIDLSEVCQQYRARVIRITPLDDCYLLETNRGPKELHVWPRVDVMRWSFAWRERLARQGFREVERFIRTRDTKPFLIMGKRGVTMTDHHRQFEQYQPDNDIARQCGRVIAMMHQSQQESPLLSGSDLLKQEKQNAVEKGSRAKSMVESFRAKHGRGSKENRWVSELMTPMLQRMDRSAAMLTNERITNEAVSVSHRDLLHDNWGMVNGKLYLRGFFRPVISVQQRDVATFLRDHYLTHKDLNQIDAFLDGYEEIKPLTYGNYSLILAFMARPREVYRSIESYVKRVSLDQEASITGIEHALQSQQSVDSLLRHIAERAERSRREGVYESL